MEYMLLLSVPGSAQELDPIYGIDAIFGITYVDRGGPFKAERTWII